MSYDTTSDSDFEYITGVADDIGDEVRALGMLPPFPPHRVPRGAAPTPALEKYFPRLPLSERDQRWDKLRKRMLFNGVDVLIVLGNDLYWDMGIANLRYIFGIGSKMGSQGLFFLDQDPVLYNAVPHMSQPFHMNSVLQDWTTDLRIAGGVRLLAAELRDRGLGNASIGLAGFSSVIQAVPTLLAGDVQAMKNLLPNATFTDFTPQLQELRMVKSEVEIELMRTGGKIARKVVDAMVRTATPGATEAEVFGEMIRAQIANGGEPNVFNLFASGPVEHPDGELWHLLHGTDQPAIPTMRPIAEGDLVIAEWHTKYGGYLVHTEYTTYVGDKPPAQLQRIWDVSLECLDASREALVPGRTIGEAIAAIRRPCERAGLDFVELGFHGMGLASPEFPTVVYRSGFGFNAANGHGTDHLVLEEGMALGNNIDIFDPAWKPDVGCMLADFMIVRPGGAELLVDTPRQIGVGGSS